ncbi:MAG: hypothetical protein ABIH23_20440 [bacterium]
MNDMTKKKPVVLRIGVAAFSLLFGAIGVFGEVAAQTSDESANPLLAQSRSSRRSSLRSSSSFGSQGYNQGYNQQGYNQQGYNQGYQSNQRGSRLSDRNSDRRTSSRRTSSRYSPQANLGFQQPGQEETTSESAAPSARPGRTTRPTKKSSQTGSAAATEPTVDVAKPTTPQQPARAGRPAAPGRARTPGAAQPAKPQSQWATLYMTVNADQIIVGDVFSVDIRLSNPKKIGFDHLAAVVQYDPVFLRPVGKLSELDESLPEPAESMIDDVTSAPARTGVAAVSGKEEGPYIRETIDNRDRITLYENTIDSDRGLLSYIFEVTDETCTAQGRVASVHFEALQPTVGQTKLAFHFADSAAEPPEGTSEPGTGLSRGDEDCLGLPLRTGDGTIDRGISILSEKPSKNRVRSLDRGQTDEEVYPTHLRLKSDQDQIVVGEEFDVYVELENPDHERFDQISLLVAYNPRVLEVIDYDEDNAVTRGLNIHDGSYREAFPFDYSIMNSVNTETGVIDYRMRGYRRPLRAEGTLACIRFRALKATSKTTLRIFLDRDGKDPTTGLFYRFQDVLGDSTDPTDGVSTCSVQIGRLQSAAAPTHKGPEGG